MRFKKSWPVAAIAVAAVAAHVIATHVAAQDYPARPVTFIVPYPAGGATDVMARMLGQKLEQRLGKPFVIENRPGAASSLAAAHLAKQAADGYTIMLGTSTTMAINVSVYKSLAYDPMKDLAPVAMVAGIPFILVVNPALPVHSIEDLRKLAATRPGGVAYASNGHGGAGHLFAELLKTMLGIEMTHVPYKGLAPALSDVVAGHVPVMFGDFSTALPLVRDGKVRALGVSTAQRVPAAPQIAPLAEAGVPGFDASSWQMVIAPAGLPKDLHERLNAELRAIVGQPETQKLLGDRGLIPLASAPPDELKRFVKAEIVRWGDVVRKAGAAGTQ
jgi:tripartite-type tricarboxylate transporter receptor subunit TctC